MSIFESLGFQPKYVEKSFKHLEEGLFAFSTKNQITLFYTYLVKPEKNLDTH